MEPSPTELLGCFRCGHRWRPLRRTSPRMCPRCKSRYWGAPVLRPVREGRGLGIADVVGPHRSQVVRLAQEHGFRHLRVFGSVRRHEATPKSDIDLLVDRDPGASLLDRAALVNELGVLLGRSVDVVPEESLHWMIRPQVLFEAVPL